MARNSLTDSQDLSPGESEGSFLARLSSFSKAKERSFNTHMNIHSPLLKSLLDQSQLQERVPIDVVYIGDSFVERLHDPANAASNLARMSKTLNLGVGGDKVENVLFRLSIGLYQLLCGFDVRLFVVHIGTNNLTSRMPLGDQFVQLYQTLVRALLRTCNNGQVLCTGLFERNDSAHGRKAISDMIVRASTRKMEQTVQVLADETATKGKSRVKWLDASEQISTADLSDHVHLNENGYRKWDEILYRKITAILAEES